MIAFVSLRCISQDERKFLEPDRPPQLSPSVIQALPIDSITTALIPKQVFPFLSAATVCPQAPFLSAVHLIIEHFSGRFQFDL